MTKFEIFGKFGDFDRLAHFEGNLKANLKLWAKIEKNAKFKIFSKFGDFDRVGTF